MDRRLWLLVVCAALMGVVSLGGASASSRAVKAGVISPLASQVRDLGPAPAHFRLNVVVGLKLRHKARLDAFLAEASNPSSPNFQHFLTQRQFNARYGPTRSQQAAVERWLRSSGFRISRTFRNRLLVAASGDARAAQRAFGVSVHRVLFHGARKYAILSNPTIPTEITSFTSGVIGLDNLTELHPASAVGSACCHFSPADVRTFYDDQVGLDGTGQTITIVTAKAVKGSDLQEFDGQWGLPSPPQGSGQVCVQNGTSCTSSAGIETTADVEWAHAAAPGAVIKWYTVNSPGQAEFTAMMNQVVSDNPGHVVSMSWGACEPVNAPVIATWDDSLANGAAIGQTWLLVSGDRGSTGYCPKNGPTVMFPASSPYVVAVGGTTAVCRSGMTPQSPDCGGYGSESGWSGSGGGPSAVLAKPAWQSGCGVPDDGARDVPDISLLAAEPWY